MTEKEIERLRAELAQAREEATLLNIVLTDANELHAEVRAELTDACAARDALATELAQRQESQAYTDRILRETNDKLATAVAQVRDELAHAKVKINQLRAELAQAQRQLSTTVQRCGYCGYRATGADAFNMVARHIKSCPSHPLAEALAELAQAREELAALDSTVDQLLEQLGAAETALGELERERDKWRMDWESVTVKLLSAEAALADARRVAGLWYRRAHGPWVEVEITGQEMVEALRAERQLRRKAELIAHDRDNICREEYSKRLEAEQNAGTLRLMMTGISEALDECGVRHYHYKDLDDEGMSTRARVLSLGQRATRAEALATLVNEELAALLERLGKRYGWSETSQLHTDCKAARALAARIREALALEATE